MVFRRLGAFLLVALMASAQVSRPDAAIRIDAWLDEGFAALPGGKYLDAERLGRQALELSQAERDSRRTARSLLLVGSALFNQGNMPKALETIQSGERLAIDLQDVPLQKIARQVLGNIHRNLGHAEEALAHFQAWVALNRQLPVPEPEGRLLRAQGIVYYEMGENDKADALMREALVKVREAKDPALEAATLMSLAILRKTRRQFEQSVPLLEDARQAATRAGAQGVLAEVMNALAHSHIELGHLDEASALLTEDVELATRIGYTGLLSQLNERLALVEIARGRPADAIPYFARSIKVHVDSGGNPEKQWFVQHEWAKAERTLGRRDAALEHLLESIRLIEYFERHTVQNEAARAQSISIRRPVFEDTAALLVDMGRTGDALEMADRSRARAFLDTLRDARIEPGTARASEPPLAKVAAIQAALPNARAAFVEYFLGQERSFVWVVRTDRVRMAALPPRAAIDAAAAAYRAAVGRATSALTAARDIALVDRQAREMYDAVLAPIAADLADAAIVTIVPDGSLSNVPFEALRPSSAQYVIERYAVSYSPSAAIHLMLPALAAAKKPAPRALLAFGDPRYGTDPGDARAGELTALPHTREEVEAIARLYPAAQRDVRLGLAATEAAVKRADLSQFRYLHFAVHGLVDEKTPARSGLALTPSGDADDGVLRMEEVTALRLNADLVTLSACGTGAGKLMAGEGVMSLSRGFFYAGAREVVATLWDVNDAATAELMRRFYTALRSGQAPADALRAAKLQFIRGDQPRWRHAYFWSPFVAFQ